MPDEIDARENTKRLMLLILSILVILVCAGTGGYALKRVKDINEGPEVEGENLQELDGKISAQREKNKKIEDAFLAYSEPVGWRLKSVSSLDRLASHGLDDVLLRASLDQWLDFLKTKFKDEVPPDVMALHKWSDETSGSPLTLKKLFEALHEVARKLDSAAADYRTQADTRRGEGETALVAARTAATSAGEENERKPSGPMERFKNASSILVKRQQEYWEALNRLESDLREIEQQAASKKVDIDKEKETMMKDKALLQRRFQDQKEQVDRAREQQEEDGEILHVDLDQKTCIVNLTRRDKVFRGTRFRVYGVEAGGKRVDKGEIEITSVGEEFTSAAITREPDPNDPKGRINAFKAGDRFFNEFFNRGIVRTIAFAGRMKGKFSREDLAARAREWGDVPEERVGPKTDLLVVGEGYAAEPNYAEAQKTNVRIMTEKYFYDYLGLEY